MIFSRKILLVLFSINLTNFTVSLPLLLEVLDNMYIVIICFPVHDVINFGNKLSYEAVFSYDQNRQDLYSKAVIYHKYLTTILVTLDI